MTKTEFSQLLHSLADSLGALRTLFPARREYNPG
jgi:hypothetical protein